MSLDVYLEGKKERVSCICSDCGNEHKKYISTSYYSSNITHNLTLMANKAGIYYALWRPEEKGWKKAKDIIPILEKGLKKLYAKPSYFRKFNPENGWGSYENLVEFTQDYLESCKNYPNAIIYVSR